MRVLGVSFATTEGDISGNVNGGYVELATDSARVLPGDGIMPLKEIILSIIAIGYQGYYSVELFSQYLWNQGPQQAARTAFESTSHLFDEMVDGN